MIRVMMIGTIRRVTRVRRVRSVLGRIRWEVTLVVFSSEKSKKCCLLVILNDS